MTNQFPPAPGSPEPTTPAGPWQRPQQYGDSTVPNAPSPDPWASTHQVPPQPAPGAPTVGGTTAYPAAPGFDPASATYLQIGPDDAQPGQRKGKRRAFVVSSLVVVLLLIGVGAYAGVRVWTGSGTTQPENAMPASVTAFARIDVNPGLGQKLNVDGLVKKFPTGGKSASDLIAKIEADISKSAGLNFDTDVKPWFGGQAGVGLWTDTQGKPVVLIALASKDDNKARAALSSLQQQKKGSDSFGFAMEKGYALIAGSDGDMQAAATAAAAATSRSPLSDDSAYRSAVSHIGSGNLLVAYANLNNLGSLISGHGGSMFGSDSGGAGLGGLGGLGALAPGLGAPSLAAVHGQVAIGGKITNDGIEIRAHVQGTGGAADEGTRAMPALQGMPAATMVGASFAGLDPKGQAAKSLSSALGALAAGGLGAATGSGSDVGGGSGSGSDNPLTGFLTDGLTQLLTSKQLNIAFTGLGADSIPGLQITVQARDAASADKLANSVDQLMAGAPSSVLKVSHDGTTIHATVGSPDVSGTLGSSSLFKETMSGMSSSSGAIYVDFQKVIGLAGTDMSQTDRANLAPIKAIGLSSSTDSSSADLLIRVVIK